MFMLLHDYVNRIVIMNVIVMVIVRTTLVAVNKGDILSGLHLTISWRIKKKKLFILTVTMFISYLPLIRLKINLNQF